MNKKECWSCHGEIDETDRYCRYCGNGQGGYISWYLKPLWIVILTLTVLGPFSLYLVWKTPALGRQGKFFLVLLVGVVSYYLVAGTMEFVRQLQLFFETATI